jgi:hypothetical protein
MRVLTGAGRTYSAFERCQGAPSKKRDRLELFSVWQPVGASAKNLSTPERLCRISPGVEVAETLESEVAVLPNKPLPTETTASGQAETEIDLRGDLEGFFGELMEQALEERRVIPTDAARLYLTALLADYARPGANRDPFDRPFALLFAEAEDSSGGERFERFRALGDGALYVRGFFWEHLETRGVALRYVSAVGARAYDGARHMLGRAGGNSATDVFGELAERFDVFVELFGAVADRLLARAATSNGEMVKLYERWLRTGSSALGEALAQRGLVPIRALAGVH